MLNGFAGILLNTVMAMHTSALLPQLFETSTQISPLIALLENSMETTFVPCPDEIIAPAGIDHV